MHSSPLWLFTGASRALVISIRAIRVMPCYDLSGKPFMVIKSGHRMESSVPSSRELRLDYNHAPLTWTGLPFHLMSTAANWRKRNARLSTEIYAFILHLFGSFSGQSSGLYIGSQAKRTAANFALRTEPCWVWNISAGCLEKSLIMLHKFHLWN